jgi:hypothetical protein
MSEGFHKVTVKRKNVLQVQLRSTRLSFMKKIDHNNHFELRKKPSSNIKRHSG